MTHEQDLKTAWQAGGGGAALPSPAELHKAASRFDRRVRNRNLREYVAGIAVIAWFGFVAATTPLPLLKLACGLIVAGTLIVLWQLHRRGAAADTPAAMGAASLIAHQRAQLARQHAALESVLWWYLAPLMPGLLLFLYAAAPSDNPRSALISLVICAAIFGGVWWLNQHGAARLAKQIAELDALSR